MPSTSSVNQSSPKRPHSANATKIAESMMRRMDVNGDGVITRREWPLNGLWFGRHPRVFARMQSDTCLLDIAGQDRLDAKITVGELAKRLDNYKQSFLADYAEPRSLEDSREHDHIVWTISEIIGEQFFWDPDKSKAGRELEFKAAERALERRWRGVPRWVRSTCEFAGRAVLFLGKVVSILLYPIVKFFDYVFAGTVFCRGWNG